MFCALSALKKVQGMAHSDLTQFSERPYPGAHTLWCSWHMRLWAFRVFIISADHTVMRGLHWRTSNPLSNCDPFVHNLQARRLKCLSCAPHQMGGRCIRCGVCELHGTWKIRHASRASIRLSVDPNVDGPSNDCSSLVTSELDWSVPCF